MTSNAQDKTHVKMKDSALTEEFRIYATNTTLHGINHTVADTSWLRRFLWLVSFLCLFGWFTYYFVDRVTYLRSSPTTTKITIHDQDTLQFPAVTICNYNSLRKSVITTNSDYEYLGSIISDVSTGNILEHYDIPSGALGINMSELSFHAAHKLNDTILSCSISTHSCEKYFNIVSTKIGYCFTFNSHEFIEENGLLFNVSRSGVTHGLSVTVNVQQEEYYTLSTLSAGIKVLVHDPDTFPSIEKHGFGVMPGTETRCAISEFRGSSLEAMKAFGDNSCVDTQSEDFVNPLEYYKHYSTYACKQECVTKIMLQKCLCVPFFLSAPGERECTTTETFNCALKVEVDFLLDAGKEKACGCKKPCYQLSYKHSLSSALYPSKHILQSVMDIYSVDEDYLSQNLLELKIYFEDVKYESIEQIPSYTWKDFEGDVGGQLGLCLGASIISLFEMFEFLFLLVKRVCCGKDKEKKVYTAENAAQESDNPTGPNHPNPKENVPA